jgi:CheY-like chemotaxis protein
MHVEVSVPKVKILIVDDNHHTRNILRLTFSRLGEYDIFEATQGIEAIAIFNDQMPDIVFLDIMMPEMDGIEVCRLIKSTPTNPHCIVILLSAKVSKPDIEEGLNAGADRYLFKPFSPLQLIEIIDEFNKNSLKKTNLSQPVFDANVSSFEGIHYNILTGFNEERLETLEMMLGSQQQVLQAVKKFIVDTSSMLGDLQALLASGDFSEATRKLHTLKGCAADLGANDVSALAHEIEEMIKQNKVGELSPKMKQLSQAWQIVEKTVNTLL